MTPSRLSTVDYLAELERTRQEEIALANRQLDKLAQDIEEREAERKRLWGDRYPFCYTSQIQPPESEQVPEAPVPGPVTVSKKKPKAKTRKKKSK